MPCSTPGSRNAAGAGSSCSACLRNATRATTGPIRPAGVSSSIFGSGTRRAIRTRISPKPSRCGCGHARTGGRAMPAGRRCKKLEYVDELMGEIGGTRPPGLSRERIDPLHPLSQTLGEHYRKKQAFYAFTPPKTYDRDLSRLFSADPRHRRAAGGLGLHPAAPRPDQAAGRAVDRREPAHARCRSRRHDLCAAANSICVPPARNASS